jgi:hypothetical protein
MNYRIVKINSKPKEINFRRLSKFFPPEVKCEYSIKLRKEEEISCINIIRRHLEEKGKYERSMKSFISEKLKDNICIFCLEPLETIKIVVSNSWSKHCGCGPSSSLSCFGCMKQFLEYEKTEIERIKRKKHIICSETFRLHEASYKVELDLMKILDETKPLETICVCECDFHYTSRIELYEHIKTECPINNI